jgi:hypothetical protein
MSNSGSLTGHAVERAGKRKAVLELTIEVNSWMNTIRSQESMNGLTGEYRLTSRKQ